jgi:hypothetical protein
MLERGDATVAERGRLELRSCGPELATPSLSHAKGEGERASRAPRTAAESERTYRVARVRIRVERVVRATEAGWRCFGEPIRTPGVALRVAPHSQRPALGFGGCGCV